MNNLLSQIRGVVGVSGALIYHRQLEKCSMVFPASYDDEVINRLKSKFIELSDAVLSDAMMRIKLARGWAIFKYSGDFAFMVLAQEDLNVSTLNLVLKSITVTLSRNKNALNDHTKPVKFDADTLQSMLKAINLIVEYFTDSFSRFQIAEFLRKSKANLVDQFPGLKSFSVDHNAKVDLLKGSNLDFDKEVVNSVVIWIASFKALVREKSVVAGFDLRSITTELQSDLESINFYRNFQKYSSQTK